MDLVTFVIIVIISTFTPGIGKVITIRNSILYGWNKTLISILAITIAINIIAYFSNYLILFLNSFPYVKVFLEYFAYLYITYLIVSGFKQYLNFKKNISKIDNKKRSSIVQFSCTPHTSPKPKAKVVFVESFLFTLINPKQLLFFAGIFPLYLSEENTFLILIIIFNIFLIFSHIMYYFGSKYFSNKMIGS